MKTGEGGVEIGFKLNNKRFMLDVTDLKRVRGV